MLPQPLTDSHEVILHRFRFIALLPHEIKVKDKIHTDKRKKKITIKQQWRPINLKLMCPKYV